MNTKKYLYNKLFNLGKTFSFQNNTNNNYNIYLHII